MSKAKTIKKVTKAKATAKKAAPKVKAVAVVAPVAIAINPYRVGSCYHGIVAALRVLGINKTHSVDDVVKQVAKMIDLKEFASKEKRNEETGKDWKGRIATNIAVLKRADYGEPLRLIGLEVRFNGREKQAGLFKI